MKEKPTERLKQLRSEGGELSGGAQAGRPPAGDRDGDVRWSWPRVMGD